MPRMKLTVMDDYVVSIDKSVADEELATSLDALMQKKKSSEVSCWMFLPRYDLSNSTDRC